MAYILLIEPNTLLARTYTKALRHAGHEVRHTTGAQTAIIAADDRAPDMIVLELQLPVHNGIEFLQEFRSYAEWQDIPIVVNTVIPPNRLADLESALQRDYGIGHVLYKPRASLHMLCHEADR
jgi:CheY-like chemotaxis protein